MQRKVGVTAAPLVGDGIEDRCGLLTAIVRASDAPEGAWHRNPIWPNRRPSGDAFAPLQRVDCRSRRGNGLHGPPFVYGRSAFHFLRHGETRENRDGILQGQSDTELTPAGRGMAVAAAQILAEVGLGSIFASPLKRAWLTASIVAEATGLRVQAIAGLMERHWGAFEGLPKATRPPTANPETAEPIDDFSNRVTRAMNSIIGPPPILVVAHSGVFRVISATLGISGQHARLAPGDVATFVPPTAARRGWCVCPLPVRQPHASEIPRSSS